MYGSWQLGLLPLGALITLIVACSSEGSSDDSSRQPERSLAQQSANLFDAHWDARQHEEDAEDADLSGADARLAPMTPVEQVVVLDVVSEPALEASTEAPETSERSDPRSADSIISLLLRGIRLSPHIAIARIERLEEVSAPTPLGPGQTRVHLEVLHPIRGTVPDALTNSGRLSSPVETDWHRHAPALRTGRVYLIGIGTGVDHALEMSTDPPYLLRVAGTALDASQLTRTLAVGE